MKIEEVEKLLDNCYSINRIKRILRSMLMCSDICQISVLDCKNKCEKGKDCIDCFMNKFIEVDARLQKLELKEQK